MLTREGGGLGEREIQGKATVVTLLPTRHPGPGSFFLSFFKKKAMGGFRRVRTERESCRQPHGCVVLPLASACGEAESRFRMKNLREALQCDPCQSLMSAAFPDVRDTPWEENRAFL